MLHIYPHVWDLLLLLAYHQIEGTDGFSVSSEIHWQSGVNGNCQSFQAAPLGFEPATTRSSVASSNH